MPSNWVDFQVLGVWGQISTGKSQCDGYPAGKPCDVGYKTQDDDYPVQAKAMCKQFVDIYSYSNAMMKTVDCVAKCLVEEEIEIQKITCCGTRNKARLNVHFKC
jgi:hypothetical protein